MLLRDSDGGATSPTQAPKMSPSFRSVWFIAFAAFIFGGILQATTAHQHEDPFGVTNVLVSTFFINATYVLVAAPIANAYRRNWQPFHVFLDVFTSPYRLLVWSVGICLRAVLLVISLPRCVLAAIVLPCALAESLRGSSSASSTPSVSPPWTWVFAIGILFFVIPLTIAFALTRDISEGVSRLGPSEPSSRTPTPTPTRKRKRKRANAPSPSSGDESANASATEEQIRASRGFGLRTKENSEDRNVLATYFFVNPALISLLEILCEIYRIHPQDCPVQVVLIVFMYQFIEYEMDFTNEEQIMAFILYIRSRWEVVGPYINCESPLSCISLFPD